MRTHVRSIIFRAGLLGLAPLSAVTCTADSSQPTGTEEQAASNPPLPLNLNLILNAKTTITIGVSTNVFGDVGSSGVNGSVLVGNFASQDSGSNLLASKVTVNPGANVGHVLGNDITLKGNAFATSVLLGLDPTSLPQVPAVTPAAPGTTNVSTRQGQAKQLCPGQYGAISLGNNSTLLLRGGVYQVTRLHLADGARLEPAEPVVILVSGSVTTGDGTRIGPSFQGDNLTAENIRFEVGGAVTIGASTAVRAHLLVPTGKFTMGGISSLTGAIWAKTINLDASASFVFGEGTFAATTPSPPPPCDDHNPCTTDQCDVSPNGIAFCTNTPVPSGTSCGDGKVCNSAGTCDDAGQ